VILLAEGVAVKPLGFSGAVIGDVGVTEFDTAEGELVPAEFVAVTVNVYEVPGVNAPIIVELAVAVVTVVPVHPWHAGEGVIVYPVIAAPPFEVSVQFTLAVPGELPATAEPIVGAEGGPTIVIELEGAEGDPVPIEFLALTVKVYGIPVVKPPIVVEYTKPLISNPVHPWHAGEGVIVYPVIDEPPFDPPLHVRVAVLLEFTPVAVPIVGDVGTVGDGVLNRIVVLPAPSLSYE